MPISNGRSLGRLSLALLACACTQEPVARVGTFSVAWVEEPPSLTISSSDGRELLRSAGPIVDTRQTTADWEMEYGSFRATEGEEAWNAGQKLEVVTREDRTLVLSLGGTRLSFTSPVDGRLDVAVQAPAGSNRVRAHFACSDTDRFLGFGGQADAVDHRGRKIPIWTSEPGIGKTNEDDPTHTDWMLRGTRTASSYPLPTFLSNRGYAFLADTTRRSVFDVCKADPAAWTVETWDGAVTLRIFDGPSPAMAIERLTAEIGRQPLANDLALAPWNDAIFGSENVRHIAKLLRDEHIPSGAIWTEDFRGGAWQGESYRLREEWDVDRTLYPDVDKLAAELHAQGFRFLAYHNTFLVHGTRVHRDALAAGLVVRRHDGEEYSFSGATFEPTSLLDLTHPDADRFVRTRLEQLLVYGFDGWMADYAEWLPADAVLASGADAEAVHNEYPRLYHSLATGVLTSSHVRPELTTSFARSGTLRTAPHQPVVWAGDQATTFGADDGLPTVLTMGLNFGLAGISTYGHDIAGYQGFGATASTKELFFRWTTLGALSPVMRTHHGTAARANWWFGIDAETTAHFRRWATFHARLWPYLKAAAREAADHGLPIMRHLALAFPEDARMWGVEDAYLFGPSLLVAPIVNENAVSRDVVLPAGTWLGVDSGAPIVGGGTGRFEVPLTEAVLLARAGTIVPLLPEAFDTLMPAEPPLVDLDDVRGKRTLLVFAGAPGAVTDLDGTRYAVASTTNDAPDVVFSGDAPVPATFDSVGRRVVVQGAHLGRVRFMKGAAEVATVTIDGALDVSEIVLRY